MPATVGHALSATTPDDPAYEIKPSNWNETHAVTLDIAASEISGLFSNAGGVTWGLDGTNITATVETNYQSQGNYLTTAALSNHSHGNPQLNLTNLSGTTASNSAGFTLSLSAGNYLTTAALSNHSHGNPTLNLTNLSGTTASNSAGFTLSLSAGNYITTARASNDAIGLNTAQTNVTWTVNSSGISLNAGAYLTTAQPPGAYLTTARASTDAVGLNTAQTNVTWTVNSSGISLNAGAYLTTAAQSNHSHGNPTLALTNLSGTTASASNGFTLSLSAAAPGAGGGAAISGNTNSQSTGTVNFSNSNGVSFGLNTNGVMTASVALNATASEFEPIFGSSLLTNSTLGQNTLYFVPFDVQQDMSAYRVNFFYSIAATLQASNSTNSAGLTFSAALYTRGTGASTERINSMWSGSWFIRMSNSSNTQVRVTHPFGISNSQAVSTTSNGVVSSSNASTYLVNSVGGFRCVPMPISSILTPGRYWMAVAQSTQSSNAIGVIQQSVLQQSNANNIAYRPFGTSSAASNASVFPTWPGDGTYSATSGAFPATVALTLSDIRGSPTLTIPYFNFSAYTTGLNVL